MTKGIIKIKMEDTSACLYTAVEEDKLLIIEKAGTMED